MLFWHEENWGMSRVLVRSLHVSCVQIFAYLVGTDVPRRTSKSWSNKPTLCSFQLAETPASKWDIYLWGVEIPKRPHEYDFFFDVRVAALQLSGYQEYRFDCP